MKRILGLDLGTNSIGWALTNQDFKNKTGGINGLGSRIIPMSQDILGNFDKGNSISQTAARTEYRGKRRLYQRDNLRRERLHRVLNVLGFLPAHYADAIDFKHHLGQFKKGLEPKLNYRKNGNGKHEFIFNSSFEETVKEFEAYGNSGKIPYDWTLYYLRRKALTTKISKEELAWILLNFNQKRGYYQLRGEEESDNGKHKKICTLYVKEVIDSGNEVKGNKLYDVIFTNNWKYDKQVVKIEDWIEKTKEFIVTTTTNKDGSIKRTYKAVDLEKDWIAIKEKTEQDIDKSGKTVGQYIYEALLEKPSQKIRGKLVKTIERKFYKEELKAILKKQIKEHPELHSKKLYKDCIEELYPRNEARQHNIKNKGFDYLFLDDIIFYQRPLKSKKSTIANCPYETRTFYYKNGERKGEKEVQSLKCIAKSNPLFQEFRLWQFLRNLEIYQKDNNQNGKKDVKVTSQFLNFEEDWVALFDFLNEKKEVSQKNIIDYLIKLKKIERSEEENYRWNNVEDKKYPANETRCLFVNRLKKIENLNVIEFLTKEKEQHLWHLVYSVKDKIEFETALKTFAIKNEIDENSFVENFKKTPPFKSDYGSYSEKAIKKILPLMRMGKYWNENEISEDVKNRIADIIERLESINYDEEVFEKDKENRLKTIIDDIIPKQFLKSFLPFKDKNPLTGLNTYQACYAIYERHSEVGLIEKWNTPNDINLYLEKFRQHSLRNPIVEQVVRETLRVVRDIWKYYGNGEKDFFDEIHVELGRSMKNSNEKRKAMSSRNVENENTNQRIKNILEELKDETNQIRPYSPSHQEILKIYEEGVYQNPDVKFDGLKEEDVKKIRENKSPTKPKASPTSSDIKKYKLWLEQGYISPYTGQIIPLSDLFSINYQIEHIIPQSRYFDNSMSNKVICESAINPKPYKDNQTAYEFLKKQGGQIISELSTNDKTIKLFTIEEYEAHCNKYFKKNRTKLKNLLSEEIPEGFINRQLNDSRYISKLIKNLLSNIVREEGEQEAIAKHLTPVTGAITFKLKQDWGLNDKWNELVQPRFERLNKLTNSNDFGYETNQLINGKPTGKKFFRTQVPNAISKGFNKKRIDHRHHALDALVIACCTQKHTNYLNSLNAEKENYSLRDNLLIKSKNGDYTKQFKMPWNDFPMDVKEQIERMLVSFKQNLRVISKTNNKTWQWVEINGQLKKRLVPQTKGDNWAIRKPLHKETVSGRVSLRRNKDVSLNFAIDNWKIIVNENVKLAIQEIVMSHDHDLKKVKQYFKKNPIFTNGKKISKVEIYEMATATATRTALSEKFTRKHLNSITDIGTFQILSNHLQAYTDEKGKERFDLAFSPAGIDDLNKNIISLNNGKFHHPIRKVRLYEVGEKFNIGTTGNKKDKYVEAAKGTNLFFAIYWNEDKQVRTFQTIPLNEVIEHQKQVAHLPASERIPVPIDTDKGIFLYTLSPNDLVYVPTDEEVDNPTLVDFKNLRKEQIGRVFVVNDFSTTCYFTPNHHSKSITPKEVDMKFNNNKGKVTGSYDDKTASFGNEQIKDICWKLEVDRLGNILNIIK